MYVIRRRDSISSSAEGPRVSGVSVRGPSTTRSSSEFVVSNDSLPCKPVLRLAAEFENPSVCGALNQMTWKYLRKIRTFSTIGSEISWEVAPVFGFFPGETDRPVSIDGTSNAEAI